MLYKNYFLLILFFMGTYGTSFATFNVKKSTSKVRVKDGANFVTQKQIDDYGGELIKELGARISGNKISFVDGVFEDAGKKIKLTGDLALLLGEGIILSGLQTLKGKSGSSIQILNISGLDNRLEGNLQKAEAIILQDDQTSVICAVHDRVPCNIALNGGTIFLEEDLHFVNEVFFTGSGLIQLNKRNLHLGSQEMTSTAKLYFDCAHDIELHANFHLAEVWTFSGVSVLEGNGRILYLDDGGSIVVENGSSLLLRDVTIRNVSGSNICCLDSASKLLLQNVTWIQDGNYSFTIGSFEVLDKLTLAGNHTFAYQSAQTSTIGAHSKLILDRGITFSYDPNWIELGLAPDQAKSLLAFEEDTAILELRGGTLHVTTTPGLKLKKGMLRIKDKSYIVSELDGLFHMEEGVILGDNKADDDMMCEIAGGAVLEVSGGALSYKNIQSSSFDMYNHNSTISIASGAKLKLHQTLDTEIGVTELRAGSILARASGKKLLGPVYIGGAISYEVCYN